MRPKGGGVGFFTRRRREIERERWRDGGMEGWMDGWMEEGKGEV